MGLVDFQRPLDFSVQLLVLSFPVVGLLSVCLLSPSLAAAAAAPRRRPQVALVMADATAALEGSTGSNLAPFFSLYFCFFSLALSLLAFD